MRKRHFVYGVIAMSMIVIASNILVQFLLLDGMLTWGAFVYPIAFLVTDIINRFFGPKIARYVVYYGFAVGIACSLIGSQITLYDGDFGYPAVAVRIAIASGIAFLVSQLLDVTIFSRLRNKVWWQAPLTSSIIGSTVDTLLFFTIGFSAFISFGGNLDSQVAWAQEMVPFLMYGELSPLWISLAVVDWGVKCAIALLALFPFRLLAARH